jgi:hypothetical protein
MRTGLSSLYPRRLSWNISCCPSVRSHPPTRQLPAHARAEREAQGRHDYAVHAGVRQALDNEFFVVTLRAASMLESRYVYFSYSAL